MHCSNILYFALAYISYTSAVPLAKRQSRPAPLSVDGNVPSCSGNGTHASGGPAIVYADVTVTTTITTHIQPTSTGGDGGALGITHSSYSTSLGGGTATSPSSATGSLPTGSTRSTQSGTLSGSSTSASTSMNSTSSIGGTGSPGSPTGYPTGSSTTSSTNSTESGSSGSSGTGYTPSPSGGNSTTASATPTGYPSGSTSGGGSQSSSGASSTNSSTPPASTPTGGSNSTGNGASPHGKKGITYNDASDLQAFSGSAGWATNWEQAGTGLPSGMSFYPMLWNDSPDRLASWAANAQAAIDRGDNVLFSFNEPVASMCPGANPPPKQPQACMTAEDAAQVWKDHMLPLKAKGAILVGPSVPQGDEGSEWLSDWVKYCPQAECGWSALALHWYEAASQIEYFKSYITDAHNNAAYGSPDVWINEFATTSGTAQEQSDFYAAAVEWMDQQSFIKGYSPFMADTLAPGGQLSPAIQGFVTGS